MLLFRIALLPLWPCFWSVPELIVGIVGGLRSVHDLSWTLKLVSRYQLEFHSKRPVWIFLWIILCRISLPSSLIVFGVVGVVFVFCFLFAKKLFFSKKKTVGNSTAIKCEILRKTLIKDAVLLILCLDPLPHWSFLRIHLTLSLRL